MSVSDRIHKLYHLHSHTGECEPPTKLFIAHPLLMHLKKEAYAYTYCPNPSGKMTGEYMGMTIYTVDNDDEVLEVA